MTWTATLNTVERIGFMVHASFTLDNGAGEVIADKVFGDNLTTERIADFVQGKIVSLEARDAAYITLKKGENQPIDLPRDAPVTPEKTAALAADAFFTLLAELNAAQIGVEKGILKPEDLTSKQIAVKSAFLPEYAKDPRYK